MQLFPSLGTPKSCFLIRLGNIPQRNGKWWRDVCIFASLKDIINIIGLVIPSTKFLCNWAFPAWAIKRHLKMVQKLTGWTLLERSTLLEEFLLQLFGWDMHYALLPNHRNASITASLRWNAKKKHIDVDCRCVPHLFQQLYSGNGAKEFVCFATVISFN